MIQTLLITKDRPLQAEACLRSLNQNASNLSNKINVLYTHSNDQFRKGYDRLFIERLAQFPYCLEDWTIEKNFRNDFLQILERIQKESEFILLLTDDTIFYKDIDFTPHHLRDVWGESVLCCSLRLGENTVIQDIKTQSRMVPPKILDDFEGWIFWDYKKESIDMNWGYPFSCDGHIYRTEDFLKICRETPFNNLRELEGNAVFKIKDSHPTNIMFAGKQSCCVNVELNMVQPPNYEKTGPYGISATELNERFLNNEVFDLDKMFKLVTVNGSHMYIKPEFKGA